MIERPLHEAAGTGPNEPAVSIGATAIALVVLLVAGVAILFVPEVRHSIGLKAAARKGGF